LSKRFSKDSHTKGVRLAKTKKEEDDCELCGNSKKDDSSNKDESGEIATLKADVLSFT
jgi:hypothetical protein